MATVHILLTSQKVKDIKIPPFNGTLEQEMGKLRKGLQHHLFIPGNKVTARINVEEIRDGVVQAALSGFTHDLNIVVYHPFPLALTDYNGPLDVEAVFSKVTGHWRKQTVETRHFRGFFAFSVKLFEFAGSE